MSESSQEIHPSSTAKTVTEHLRTGRKLQISPTDLGSIVKHDQCPRYIKFQGDDQFSDTIFSSDEWVRKSSLELLAKEGNRFEKEIYEMIGENWDFELHDCGEMKPQDALEEIEQKASEYLVDVHVYTQVPVHTEVGEFSVAGYADMVCVAETPEGETIVHVFDIKASWDEKVHHQIQASVYTLALRRGLESSDEIKGGIIHKENIDELEIDKTSPNEFISNSPEYTVEPREEDVRRLLSETGPVYETVINNSDPQDAEEAVDMLDDIPYQIDSNCENCQYRDVCFTNALEVMDLSVLKIGRGEREALKEKGFTSLNDLREIISEQEGYLKYSIKEEYRDTVAELQRDYGVSRVKDLAVQAELIYQNLNPDEYTSFPTKRHSSVETMPGEEDWDESRAIKVFLNTQYDYISDAVVAGGALIQTSDGEIKRSTSRLIEDLPMKQVDGEKRIDTQKVHDNEQELIEQLSSDILEAISSVADEAGLSAPYLHCYVYGSQEQSVLTDSIDNHENIGPNTETLRNLLSVRDLEVYEQTLWSTIESELTNCYHLNGLPTFLPYTYQSFISKGDHPQTFWDYQGDTYELHNIFDEQFFNFRRDFEMTDSGLDLEPPSEYSAANMFEYSLISEGVPVESYSGANVPLEYIWGCTEYDLAEYMAAEDEQVTYIDNFLYESQNTDRISGDAVRALLDWIVHSLSFIESVMDLNKSSLDLATVNKKAYPVEDWRTFRIDSSSLGDAVREYELTEFVSQRADVRNQVSQTVEQRVSNGRAIPIFVNNVQRDGGALEIEGYLAYNQMDFENPEYIKSSMKYDAGDYVLANQLSLQNNVPRVVKDSGNRAMPHDILNAPEVKITHLDLDNNIIRLSYFQYGSKKDAPDLGFQSRLMYEDLAEAKEGYGMHVNHGKMLLLDESVSTYLVEQSLPMLEHIDVNPLYNRINNLLHGRATVGDCPHFDSNKIDAWLSDLKDKEETEGLDYVPYPNKKQRKFIESTADYTVLQGPPGTGKTSGSAAMAIGARIASYNGTRLTGLVTGPSNTSIDEVLKETVPVLDEMDMDAKLIRVLSQSQEEVIDHPKVEYYDSSNLEGALTKVLNSSISSTPCIFFATPSLLKRLFEAAREDSIAMDPVQVFDFMFTDEASMQTLPQFFMSGAFIKDDAQVLLAGDHRQMAPVQTHEWTEETRPSSQKFVPYLSALNYMRYLRGEDIERIDDDNNYVLDSPEADIPFVQLERTYRCHKDVAAFLRRWVYEQDNLAYKSNLEQTISLMEQAKTEGLQSVLKEEAFVLVTHTDDQSQQSNRVEAEIIEALSQEIGEKAEANKSLGVVTPHSSQRGLLKDRDLFDAEVDTVESFQGSGRDAIFVSATVSDPSFIRQEDDFLLNPNRINVALSRMREKLVLVVPETVFEHIPSDLDTYDKSVIWNGVYEELAGDISETAEETRESADWSGSLEEFTGSSSIDEDITVSVYTNTTD